MQQAATVHNAVKPLTEQQATEVMWVYYRDHKAQLAPDIKEYRDFILTELVKGTPAEQVFARFTRLPEPPAPARRVR
jgi:hypothetical protein